MCAPVVDLVCHRYVSGKSPSQLGALYRDRTQALTPGQNALPTIFTALFTGVPLVGRALSVGVLLMCVRLSSSGKRFVLRLAFWSREEGRATVDPGTLSTSSPGRCRVGVQCAGFGSAGLRVASAPSRR